MWIWDFQLQALGFVRKSDRYWRCERRFGLPENAHLSIFSWSEQRTPRNSRRPRYLVEVTEFHVTIVLAGEHLHFYYHELDENVWHPGGYTSGREIRRVGGNKTQLRALADAIAAEVVEGWYGTFVTREALRERKAKRSD